MKAPGLLLALCFPVFISLSSCRKPIPTAPDREAIATTVTAFHDALAKGDRAAVLALLAPDAQIVETGHRQTREEYESEHLGADVEFAKAVPSTRSALIVRQEGNAAWTTATGRSTGTYKGRPVNSENAELMVLAKTDEGWRIRAVHWSSHSGGH
ncbi:MAG: nuclear transport factor 2 family protein [Chthoniobacterales bacterium]|nr:nuclear transport factor 2 family protein [Chthoniobacterales bacterium]